MRLRQRVERAICIVFGGLCQQLLHHDSSIRRARSDISECSTMIDQEFPVLC
jgi:hypothetical protein